MQEPGLGSSTSAPIVARRTVTREACESIYAQPVSASRTSISQLATLAMPDSATSVWTLAMRFSMKCDSLFFSA